MKWRTNTPPMPMPHAPVPHPHYATHHPKPKHVLVRIAHAYSLALVSAGATFLLAEATFALVIGAPWVNQAGPTHIHAFTVALPLSLPLAFVSAVAAWTLRHGGWWAFVPGLVAAPFVVGAVSFSTDWLVTAGAQVEAAAVVAWDENGLFFTRWLWDHTSGAALLLALPFFAVVFFLDILATPFVLLLTPSFMAQATVFALKCGALGAVGIAASAVVTIPLVRWGLKGRVRP